MDELTPAPTSAPSPPSQIHRPSSGFGDKDEHAIERKTLRDYYIILRERLWIALPAAVLVAISVGYYQMQETPMYAATATIQFERGDTITGAKGITDQNVNSEVDLNNKLSVLRSSLLADRVRKSLSKADIIVLQQPYIDAGAQGDVGTPLGDKSVEPQRNSTTISITIRHPGAQAAALVANRFADEFISYQREYAGGKSGTGVETLQEMRKTLEKETEAAAAALVEFRQKNKYQTPQDARENVTKQYQLYQNHKQQATLDRTQKELIRAAIEAIQKNGAERLQREMAKIPPNSLAAAERRTELEQQTERELLENSYISSFGIIPRLRSDLSETIRQYDILGNTFLERWPAMEKLADSRRLIETQLRSAQDEALRRLKDEIANLAEQERRDQVELDRLNKEQDVLDELSIPYQSLVSALETKKANFQSISARLLEAQSSTESESVPLRVLDRAGVPGGPYTPNPGRITRMCIGLGFIVFVGLAVGLSFIDDRIKSAWDVEHFVGVNLLGIIPDLSALKDEEKYTLVLNDSEAPGTESFLSVYSSVKIHSKLDFPKSILITSTIPGEGKTLISCNLAGSFARHGKRTLLIDCDLRRPMLHRHFRRENNKGLITWFEGGAPLEGDLTQDPTLGIINIGPNFSLLCSGGRSRVPTEILESAQFANLLQRLKKMYDLVVIDSPPLGAVTDSLLIAERADEVIYVCRFNRAYKKHIRLHVKALRNGKNEILGVVLNGLSPRRIEYYSNYRYYRSYKKYYGAQT